MPNFTNWPLSLRFSNEVLYILYNYACYMSPKLIFLEQMTLIFDGEYKL